MGQQSSRKSSHGECGCGCSWERSRRFQDAPSSVHKYVSALTDRWSGRQCACRRGRNPECVCTSYRPRADNTEDRVQVLTLESTELRRGLDALVIADETSNENRDTVPEVYVLSVAPRGSTGPAMGGGVQVVCGELRALLVRGHLPPLAAPPDRGNTRVHSQMDYIHCLVPDLQEITACSFYWGKMDRYEAEKLLDNKPEGTFLLRDSAQEEHLFSVSFRKYGRSLHARIEHYQNRFSFDLHDPAVYSAPTVTGLIDHYKDPACVMFFEPMLTSPLPRRTPFSLQQLARAVIVSHITYDGVEKLPLPPRIRSYLKEYHYRQRVRLRRLDTDVYQPY